MVKTFKSKTSTGYDEISMKLIKQIIYSIASPLEYIFNLSLQNGTCPDMLNLAKVIPIHKIDDKTHADKQLLSYFFITCHFKNIRKDSIKRLISFLTINNILIYHSLVLGKTLQLILPSYNH